jgi:hypothetical protein
LPCDPKGWYKLRLIERSKVQHFCGFLRFKFESLPLRQLAAK